MRLPRTRTAVRAPSAILACALAVLLAACGSSSGNAKPSASNSPTPQSSSSGTSTTGGLTSITYVTDYLSSGLYAGMWYAQKHGFYARNGVALHLEYGTGSVTTAQTVATGHADIGDVFSGIIAKTVAAGAPLQAVGFFRGQGGFAFFCDKKLGITSVKQLAGKSVIIPPGTVQAELYPGALKAAGMSASSIHVLSISSAVAGSTYARGTGDCIVETVTDAPTFQKLRPSKTLLWTSVGFNMPGFAFVVTHSYLASHAKAIAGFLKATYEGIYDAVHNSAAAVGAYLSATPTASRSLATAQWGAAVPGFCTQAMDSAGANLGYQESTDWQSAITAMRQYAGLPSTVTASQLYTNQFFASPYNVSSYKCGTF